MSYYDRESALASDGTHVFATDDDRQSESEVADILSRAWDCDIKHFGRLCPIDFYATRDGRLVSVIEIKTRSHDSGRYPSVFLNVRKWLALSLAAAGLGVPALFVVRFSDEIRWVDSTCVSGPARIAGCRTIVKSHSDVEPVFDVPVSEMKLIKIGA